MSKACSLIIRKWNVKPQFNSNLDNIENILKNEFLKLNIRIEGHTDDIGSMAKYNIDLSGKRG